MAYTEPPQWRRIGVNGALFAQSEGGNVGGSEGRLIAASLSAPENALPLRSRPSAKQKMMLEFRPRNACEILQFFFASAFGTAQKMPRQRGSRRGIVAGLVVGFNDVSLSVLPYGSLTRWEKILDRRAPDAVSTRRCRHCCCSCPLELALIFLLDVLLYVPAHLDQAAPNLLEERNHPVDLGIARQLDLALAGLCA